jgi:hypothetical protein
MAEQHAGRERRAFGLLQGVGGWEYVDGGAFGHSHWLVPSQTGTDERYHVTSTSCTCLDFAYRGRDVGACKHILGLRAMLHVLRAQADA